jgi:hypothetical protein
MAFGEILGLACSVATIHGNHEGFDRLEGLTRGSIPTNHVAVEYLPTVVPNGRSRYPP